MESDIWVEVLFWVICFILYIPHALILYACFNSKEETMKEEKNDTASQYATLVLNNHINDVVKFQECMLQGVLETRAGWDDENEFLTMKRFNEDILAVLKMVQSTSEEEPEDDKVEYLPMGFRTDDIN